MTIQKIVVWSVLVVPWFTLFFMKRDLFKRYLPVTLFTTLLVTYYHQLAYTQEWWIVNVNVGAFTSFTPTVFGSYFVGTLWIFALTYGNFKLYFIINVIINAIYIFVIKVILFLNLGIMENVTAPHWHRFFVYLSFAVIIYGYQKWQEGIFKEGDYETHTFFGFNQAFRR
jgi:hypothetical protein